MTRAPELGACSSESTRSLLSLFRTGVAGTLKWIGTLPDGLLGTRRERDLTPRASKQDGFGFLCSYSDAELQIMLAELHYPRPRQGSRRR
jgi:hypothetical protein